MPQRFFDALHARDFELFDALMVEMPRVNLARLRTDEGATLLHVAAQHGLAGALLERIGVVDAEFVSVKDQDEREALHCATTLLRVLTAYRDHTARSPLHFLTVLDHLAQPSPSPPGPPSHGHAPS